ncbi:MAG: aspartate/glutamate racemase family protein [Deltaproteobacteria bacterium]|nr:aspartate/glutamate racemase family protein [Deltaproteobacteria bacterium]
MKKLRTSWLVMIGIFDSTIGGISVASECMNLLPDWDLVFLADTRYGHCGKQPDDFIMKRSLRAIDRLLSFGIRILVVACPAVSSMGMDVIKRRSMVPVFDIITPAVELATEASKFNRIGILGTRDIIERGFLQKKIEEETAGRAKIYTVAAPLLVPLIQEGWINKPEARMILKKYLHRLKIRQIDTLIVASTYCSVITHVISRKMGKRVRIVDPAAEIAGRVKAFLKDHMKNGKRSGGKESYRFLVSDPTDETVRTAEILLKKKYPIEAVSV